MGVKGERGLRRGQSRHPEIAQVSAVQIKARGNVDVVRVLVEA